MLLLFTVDMEGMMKRVMETASGSGLQCVQGVTETHRLDLKRCGFYEWLVWPVTTSNWFRGKLGVIELYISVKNVSVKICRVMDTWQLVDRVDVCMSPAIWNANSCDREIATRIGMKQSRLGLPIKTRLGLYLIQSNPDWERYRTVHVCIRWAEMTTNHCAKDSQLHWFT